MISKDSGKKAMASFDVSVQGKTLNFSAQTTPSSARRATKAEADKAGNVDGMVDSGKGELEEGVGQAIDACDESSHARRRCCPHDDTTVCRPGCSRSDVAWFSHDPRYAATARGASPLIWLDEQLPTSECHDAPGRMIFRFRISYFFC